MKYGHGNTSHVEKNIEHGMGKDMAKIVYKYNYK